MADAAALRRLEEAGFNAWPALQTALLDGWVLRFADGYTKRANSVNPLYPGPGDADLEARVAECEGRYARQRLPAIFRLTSFGTPPGLDALLAARGYRVADPTLVLTRPLEDEPTPRPDVRVVDEALEAWLPRYAAWTGALANPAGQATHAAMLRRITGEARYATLYDEQGVPAALGLAVREGALVGLFDIVTDPARRRAGYGRALVAGMLAWAAEAGASTAYLQVMEANAAARALYDQLGFARAYAYWYRIPSPG